MITITTYKNKSGGYVSVWNWENVGGSGRGEALSRTPRAAERNAIKQIKRRDPFAFITFQRALDEQPRELKSISR